MRTIFAFIVSIFIFSNLIGQTKKDSSVLAFIKSKKEFVALIDTTNLPIEVKPYYKTILDYLAKNKEDKNDYYVGTNEIKNETTSIFIPMYLYSGFKKLKELEDEDREANKNLKVGELQRVTVLTGNASGSDGNMEIDKKTKKVIAVWAWQ